MSSGNDSKFQPAVFLFTGIPGQEDFYIWISIPFCVAYAISILGNSFILFIIKTDPKLHEPMYIFLSMLAVTDLAISISTMPTTLGIFLFKSRVISHDACFAQMFFFHFFTFNESSVLLCMAFDRCLAICNPMRYKAILTPFRIAIMGLVCVLRGVILSLPFPILLTGHRFCQADLLTSSFCMEAEVRSLPCSDIRVNINYSIFVTVFADYLDFLLILLSYMIILKTVLKIASHRERLKTLNTCVSHVCIIMLYYIPSYIFTIMSFFVRHPSAMFLIFTSNIAVLFPTIMNPIVYSMKTKHFRARISVLFK